MSDEPIRVADPDEGLPAGELPEVRSGTETGDPANFPEGAEGKSKDKPQERDYERMFKDTQAAFTRSQQELAELRGQLQGFMAAKKPEQEPNVDIFKMVEDEVSEELKGVNLFDDEEKAKVSIAKAVSRAMRKPMSFIGETLAARDAFYEERIRGVDPEVRAVAEKMAELKDDPDCNGFSDQELEIAARFSLKKGKKQKEQDSEDRFRGSPGGGGRVAVTAKKDTEADRYYKRLMEDDQ